MAPVFIIGKLSTTSNAVRDEYVQHLLALSKIAQDSEPDTTKYAVCVPRDSTDDKVSWVIEEYASKAAFDEHMASPQVADMIKWMQSGNILAGEPEIHSLSYVDNCSFAKPEVVKVQDPHISFARIEFQPGKRAEALPAWKAVYEETKSESGSYVYGLVVDEQKPDILYTMQAYESEEYLRQVHLKENKAVKGTMETLKMSIGVKHNNLKIVGGYLTRQVQE